MRIKSMLLMLLVLTTLIAGCTKTGTTPGTSTTPGVSTITPGITTTTPGIATTTPGMSTTTTPAQQTSPATNSTETVSSASIVDNVDAFIQSISRGGTWIIITKKDLTINKDLVVDGDFKNTKNPPVSQRKIALYDQDANRKVTARYKLTAPKMTIKSPDCGLWYGTFKGDIYVSAKNFQLVGATVDGNIYFTTDEAKATFKADTASKVTGKQELKK